jgi:Flp pilus assembly protein TadD
MNIEHPGTVFDMFTTEVIRLNRDRPFREDSFPVPKKRINEAIALFDSRAIENRGESELHKFLSLFYLEKGDCLSATREINKAMQLNPDYVACHNILGIIYLNQGEIDKAIEEYHKAVVYSPNLPDIHYNLGLAYSKKGMIDLAIASFKKSIELNPHLAKAYASLGCLYLKRGKKNLASEEFQSALELFPEDTQVLCASAAACIIKYDSLKKVTLSKNMISPVDDEKRQKPHNGNELLKKAGTQCRKAIAINPDLPDAHNILGIVYAYQDNFNKAESELLQALELRPNFLQAHHNLGLLYFKNDLFEKSAVHIKKMIDIYVSSGYGSQILSKIFQNQKKYYVSLVTLQ